MAVFFCLAGISAGSGDVSTRKNSKLSKNLHELLKDHGAIPYLVQYMESCKAGALIKFWSDADSFQASTWTRLRSHSMNSVGKSLLIKDRISKSSSHDIASLESSGDGNQETKLQESTVFDSSVEEHKKDNSSPYADLSKGSNITNLTVTESENSNMVQSDVSDSDSRTREKCKDQTVLDKSKLQLPITNCDNSNASVFSESLTNSAISYRDITSSGPATPDSGKGSSKSAISPGFGSVPKESLAEKLKKSRLYI